MATMASGHYEQNSKEKEEYSSSSDSSSSSEDEEGEALTEQLEKDWLRTLGALKRKDPRIYDKDIKFYQSSDEETETKKSKKKKQKPVYLHDVQRKTLIETEGAPPPDEKIRYEEEEEEEEILPVAPSYYEEQNELKQKFMEAAPSSDEDEDLLVKKGRSDIKEEECVEEEYRMFLKGKKKKLKIDKRLTPELSILKDYWSKPDLDEGEQFLRDYILNRGYKDKDKDKLPSYKEIVEDESFDEEEKTLKKQEDYEREYNFRFEEPDKNFIKSHPRKIKDSVRPEDTKRVEKRKKVLERKKKEMEMKQEELKKIKKKKRKEIMDKIAELKEITGNSSLGIQDLDLDEEFDAKQHEELMQKMFNDKYYKDGGEGEEMEKPVFSDDEWDGTYDDDVNGVVDQAGYKNDGEVPGCSYDAQEEIDLEDPNFNMDADYDPSESQRRSKKERKRKKKSKNEKPKFNADEMTFDEYFDEYYKLDYEDLIDDQPCRFQYRSVMPNDFGLTTQEILNTDDKELNGWCPLRKIVSYRTEQEEFDDEMIYYKRGKNMNRKKKFIPSFYNQNANGEDYEDANENGTSEYSDQKKETSKKKKRKHLAEEEVKEEEKMEVGDSVEVAVGGGESGTQEEAENVLPKKKRRKNKKKKPQQKGKGANKNEEVQENENKNETLPESPEAKKEEKEKKNKQQQGEGQKDEIEQIKKEKMNITPPDNHNPKTKNKKKRKREEIEEKVDEAIVEETAKDKKTSESDKPKPGKKPKKKQKTKNDSNGLTPKTQSPKTQSKKTSMSNTRLKKKKRAEIWRKKTDGDTKHNEDLNISLSNERLKAYGLNPKKFKYLKVAEHKSSK